MNFMFAADGDRLGPSSGLCEECLTETGISCGETESILNPRLDSSKLEAANGVLVSFRVFPRITQERSTKPHQGARTKPLRVASWIIFDCKAPSPCRSKVLMRKLSANGFPAQLAAIDRALHARLWVLGGVFRRDARERSTKPHEAA